MWVLRNLEKVQKPLDAQTRCVSDLDEEQPT